MSGIYYTEIDEVLRAAGLTVRDDGPNAGWQSRARSSGGFPVVPLGVVWHHTASNTAIENDLQWQCHSCDDAPVGNMTIDRDGVVWPVAAGASNCAGKGGPADFSRGRVEADTGNTRLWNVEVSNDGVGGRWPIAQVNSYLVASNALNSHFGNCPDDVISHALGSGDGWTSRKVDPAQAGAVEGPWQPRSCNSSGTWLLQDIKDECLARAGGAAPEPAPEPEPERRDDMMRGLYQLVDSKGAGRSGILVAYTNGTKQWVPDDQVLWQLQNVIAPADGCDPTVYPTDNEHFWRSLGIVVGPLPGDNDEWGVPR